MLPAGAKRRSDHLVMMWLTLSVVNNERRASRTARVSRLAALVITGTFVWSAIGLIGDAPWIFPDELLYSELAKSLGDFDLPAIRGERSLAYGLVYPLLVAPAWMASTDVANAYDVARVLNAMLLSLSAVPAYLLARRFVGEGRSLVVAALSIAVPSMVYAGTLMTEVALYPLAVLAFLMMARALERPTVARQLLALSAIVLAAQAKASALALIPAFLLGAGVLVLLDRRTRVRSRMWHRLQSRSFAVVAAAAFVAAGLQLAGYEPSRAIGAYAAVLDGASPWLGVRWGAAHLSSPGPLLHRAVRSECRGCSGCGSTRFGRKTTGVPCSRGARCRRSLARSRRDGRVPAHTGGRKPDLLSAERTKPVLCCAAPPDRSRDGFGAASQSWGALRGHAERACRDVAVSMVERPEERQSSESRRVAMAIDSRRGRREDRFSGRDRRPTLSVAPLELASPGGASVDRCRRAVRAYGGCYGDRLRSGFGARSCRGVRQRPDMGRRRRRRGRRRLDAVAGAGTSGAR